MHMGKILLTRGPGNMHASKEKCNLLDRLLANPGFAACGVKAEPIGRRNVRVTRGGRMLGIWRETVGTYEWLPAGHNHPQTTVLTVEEAVRHLNRSFGHN